MRRIVVVPVTLVAALLVAVPSSLASTGTAAYSYSGSSNDPAGDAVAGPDITRVAITYNDRLNNDTAGAIDVEMDFAQPLTDAAQSYTARWNLDNGGSCPSSSGAYVIASLSPPYNALVRGEDSDIAAQGQLSPDGLRLTVAVTDHLLVNRGFNCGEGFTENDYDSSSPCFAATCDSVTPFALVGAATPPRPASSPRFRYRACSTNRGPRGVRDLIATNTMTCAFARLSAGRWVRHCARERRRCDFRFNERHGSTFFSCYRRKPLHGRDVVTCDNPQERQFIFTWRRG